MAISSLIAEPDMGVEKDFIWITRGSRDYLTQKSSAFRLYSSAHDPGLHYRGGNQLDNGSFRVTEPCIDMQLAWIGHGRLDLDGPCTSHVDFEED